MIRLLCFFLSPLHPNHGAQPGLTQSWCLMNMCGSEGQTRISDQLNSFSFMIIAGHLHCASISKRHEMKGGVSRRLMVLDSMKLLNSFFFFFFKLW